MNTKEQGNLGEIKATLYFIEEGFHVFSPIFSDGPIDLIIVDKNGTPFKVEVKSTSKRSKDYYQVELRSIRSNKTKNVIRKFNKEFFDFLAVYLVEDDVVKVFKTSELGDVGTFRIKMEG